MHLKGWKGSSAGAVVQVLGQPGYRKGTVHAQSRAGRCCFLFSRQ